MKREGGERRGQAERETDRDRQTEDRQINTETDRQRGDKVDPTGVNATRLRRTSSMWSTPTDHFRCNGKGNYPS